MGLLRAENVQKLRAWMMKLWCRSARGARKIMQLKSMRKSSEQGRTFSASGDLEGISMWNVASGHRLLHSCGAGQLHHINENTFESLYCCLDAVAPFPGHCKNHWITEWFGLEGILKPIRLPWAGCHSPEQAAQGPIQPDPKCLRGWVTHSFSGQHLL